MGYPAPGPSHPNPNPIPNRSPILTPTLKPSPNPGTCVLKPFASTENRTGLFQIPLTHTFHFHFAQFLKLLPKPKSDQTLNEK